VNDDPLHMMARDLIRRALAVLPSVVLLLSGSLGLLAGIFLGVDLVRHKAPLELWGIAVPMTIAGAISLVAALGRSGAGGRVFYLVLIPIVGQLLAMSDTPWFASFPVLVLQSAILIAMAVRFRFRPDIKLALVACMLAGLSYFIYQRIGPAIGVYGTECGVPPNHRCYGPVLAAGFPLQYIVDIPTISVPGSLGWEDGFRGISLLLDVLIYAAVIIAGRRLVHLLRIRQRDRRNRRSSSGKLTASGT